MKPIPITKEIIENYKNAFDIDYNKHFLELGKCIKDENIEFYKIIQHLLYIHPLQIPSYIIATSIITAYELQVLTNPQSYDEMPVLDTDSILYEISESKDNIHRFTYMIVEKCGSALIRYIEAKADSEHNIYNRLKDGIDWPILPPGLTTLYHTYNIMRYVITTKTKET
tara:strand:+ start:248 stop:754 length:507 start_codon:yes stop_codon:yes gene_type:complete